MQQLQSNGWSPQGSFSQSGQKVVAFGGGHGLSATLRALKHITNRLTAVVTVGDDGGSSGRLRSEMDVLPPGDLRMAIVSLSDDSRWGQTWSTLLQSRFHSEGELDRHSVGNLLIAGFWQMLQDPIEGLEWVRRLVNAKGRVLPMSLQPVDIEADVIRDGQIITICGQKNVALAPDRIEKVRLLPENPQIPTQVLQAVTEADWIVLGPGSWYTSVIPHLLVKELCEAIENSRARRALILNLAKQAGETQDLSSAEHLRAIKTVASNLRFDIVVADPSAVDDIDALVEAAAELGARLLLRQVRVGAELPLHDPLRLAAALRDVFDGYLGEVGKAESWLGDIVD